MSKKRKNGTPNSVNKAIYIHAYKLYPYLCLHISLYIIFIYLWKIEFRST